MRLVEAVAKEKSQGTFDNYLSICNNHVIPKIGKKQNHRLSSKDVRDLGHARGHD